MKAWRKGAIFGLIWGLMSIIIILVLAFTSDYNDIPYDLQYLLFFIYFPPILLASWTSFIFSPFHETFPSLSYYISTLVSVPFSTSLFFAVVGYLAEKLTIDKIEMWKKGAIFGFMWILMSIFLGVYVADVDNNPETGEIEIFGSGPMSVIFLFLWIVPYFLGSWMSHVIGPHSAHSEVFPSSINNALISGSMLFSTLLFFAIVGYLIDKKSQVRE